MLKYKSAEVEREFNDFNFVDARLFGMVHALAAFVWQYLRKDVTLTDCVRRTGRKDSPHYIDEDNPRSRAVDIRLVDPISGKHVYTDDELTGIRAWLKLNFARSDQVQLKATIAAFDGPSRVHVGTALHLHLVVESIRQFRLALGLGVGE